MSHLITNWFSFLRSFCCPKSIENEDIKIILVGKENNIKNAEIIANETGAKIYKLNTSLNGEINNTSYINEMKENIRILKDVEGNED